MFCYLKFGTHLHIIETKLLPAVDNEARIAAFVIGVSSLVPCKNYH